VIPQIGTGSAGEAPNRVRVDTVLGDREGAVGAAWTTALATPSAGRSPFVVLARPNLPVVPLTLFVPSAAIGSHAHLDLTRGAAHAGVAAAVLDLRMDDPDAELCLIAAVWVEPEATSADVVFQAAHDATVHALKMGAGGGPWHGHLLEVELPENDHFRRS
jgi:5,6,7,8-tetrahydromethanopterin hydro-lyase